MGSQPQPTKDWAVTEEMLDSLQLLIVTDTEIVCQWPNLVVSPDKFDKQP